jgi:hypothetical protein
VVKSEEQGIGREPLEQHTTLYNGGRLRGKRGVCIVLVPRCVSEFQFKDSPGKKKLAKEIRLHRIKLYSIAMGGTAMIDI